MALFKTKLGTQSVATIHVESSDLVIGGAAHSQHRCLSAVHHGDLFERPQLVKLLCSHMLICSSQQEVAGQPAGLPAAQLLITHNHCLFFMPCWCLPDFHALLVPACFQCLIVAEYHQQCPVPVQDSMHCHAAQCAPS